MKWKRKYLLIPVLLLLIIKCSVVIYTGGYTNEVFTAFSSSPGFIFKEDIYFLASYRLYKRPVGLRRFPDGGQSKRIFEAVYLVSFKNGESGTAFRIPGFSLSDTDVKYISGKELAGDLLLLTAENSSGELFMFNCSKKRVRAKQIRSDEITGGINLESGLSITETKRLFKDNIDSYKLPSPLDYCNKSEREFVKDVITLKGDFFYRKAVIDNMKHSSSELLEKMESYEKSLKKGRLEYSIYSEDTKNYIRGIQ